MLTEACAVWIWGWLYVLVSLLVPLHSPVWVYGRTLRVGSFSKEVPGIFQALKLPLFIFFLSPRRKSFLRGICEKRSLRKKVKRPNRIFTISDNNFKLSKKIVCNAAYKRLKWHGSHCRLGMPISLSDVCVGVCIYRLLRVKESQHLMFCSDKGLL